jgi:hypothetical protein
LNKALKSPALTRADSAFAFKYLGVAYAAEVATREKGKYFFYQLLKTDRKADLLDLFVSESVNELFRNTRAEFMAREGKSSVASTQAPDPVPTAPANKPQSGETASQPAKKISSSKKAWYWAGGTVALFAAGTGVYFLLAESDPKKVPHGPD